MTAPRLTAQKPRTAAEEGAYRDGERAGIEGAIGDSPYPIGSKLRRHWQEGWMDGDRAARRERSGGDG